MKGHLWVHHPYGSDGWSWRIIVPNAIQIYPVNYKPPYVTREAAERAARRQAKRLGIELE